MFPPFKVALARIQLVVSKYSKEILSMELSNAFEDIPPKINNLLRIVDRVHAELRRTTVNKGPFVNIWDFVSNFRVFEE